MLDSDELLFARYLTTVLPVRPSLVDVGAAQGRWTEGFCEVLGEPDPMALLFEPRPLAASLLRRQFRDRPMFLVAEEAVGETPGRATLLLVEEGDHAYIERPPGYQDLLDQYCDDHGIPRVYEPTLGECDVEITTLDRILVAGGGYVVKIDTEGHEMAVLRGARQALADGTILAVQFEYGGTWIGQGTLAEAAKLLEGFTLWQYDDNAIALVTSLDDDYWASRNYLAVKES